MSPKYVCITGDNIFVFHLLQQKMFVLSKICRLKVQHHFHVHYMGKHFLY